jgi:hypothetical protein
MSEHDKHLNDDSENTKKAISDRVKSLSTMQKDRFFGIYHRYKEGAFDIIEYFKSKRTPGQWPDFIERSDAANNESNPEYKYLQALTSKFEIGQKYDEFDYVPIVQELRAKQSQTTFTKDITQACKNEIKRVYLTDDGDDGAITPVISIMVT